jgi:hypothetical protein
MNQRPGMEYFRRDFYQDLRRGLLALWRGHLNVADTPARMPSSEKAGSNK